MIIREVERFCIVGEYLPYNREELFAGKGGSHHYHQYWFIRLSIHSRNHKQLPNCMKVEQS
jgi:hypothetical protein